MRTGIAAQIDIHDIDVAGRNDHKQEVIIGAGGCGIYHNTLVAGGSEGCLVLFLTTRKTVDPISALVGAGDQIEYSVILDSMVLQRPKAFFHGGNLNLEHLQCSFPPMGTDHFRQIAVLRRYPMRLLWAGD